MKAGVQELTKRVLLERRDNLEAQIGQGADGQRKFPADDFLDKAWIGQTGVPVIDSIDTKQLDSLAYIGCRTFLTGVDGNTETPIAAGAEEIHELGRGIADLRASHPDAENLVGPGHYLLKERQGVGFGPMALSAWKQARTYPKVALRVVHGT